MTYHCSNCGKACTSQHAVLQTVRFVGADQREVKVTGEGLGTWSCPVHGVVSVTRRKHDA